MSNRSQAGSTPKMAVKESTARRVSSHTGRGLGSLFVGIETAARDPHPTVIQNAQSRCRGPSYNRSTVLCRFGEGNGGGDDGNLASLSMYVWCLGGVPGNQACGEFLADSRALG
jgi:hypothetical protein